MARSKAFDRDTALEEALHVFWDQGYEATSVRTLIARLGLSSSTLYATFGDKRGLYLAALARYREREYREMAALLKQAPTARGALARLFHSLVQVDTNRGSFTLNAAIERGSTDPQVAAQLLEHFENLTALLAERLRAGQRQGEIDDNRSTRDLARFFLHTLYSLATFSTISPNRTQLNGVARVALSVLD